MTEFLLFKRELVFESIESDCPHGAISIWAFTLQGLHLYVIVLLEFKI
jgi:hypothetical protein